MSVAGHDVGVELAPGTFAAGRGYLNTASIGIPPRATVGAMQEAVAAWGHGLADAPSYDAPVEAARRSFARLVRTAVDDVAIGPQVSVMIGAVLASLPAGSEVVAYRGEFTSVLFPLLARDDVSIRLADTVEDLPETIGPATGLVALSAVQSADGTVADLDAVRAAATAHGAMTLLDATQACGWLPLDATEWDVLVCGAYKWLMSPRGTAFMAVRPERLEAIRPLYANWYAGGDPWDAIYGPPLRLAPDARRLNVSPAWLSWVGTVPSLALIEEIGVETIHAHDVALANRFRAGLGLPEGDSAIVAVARDIAPARLAEAGVRLSSRRGALRAAFHLYNTEADVDRALELLV